MKLCIAGASGAIGQKLVSELLAHDHQIMVITRDRSKVSKLFKQKVASANWDELSQLAANDFDVVINLAGENIANKRWTKDVKNKILESRIQTTQILANWCASATHNNIRLLNASAVSIYGIDETKKMINEDNIIDNPNPHSFLEKVAIEWEKALMPARQKKIAVITLRLGVVLDENQGILKKLIPIFNYGLGHVIGNVNQAINWIHYKDVIAAIIFLINRPDLSGAFNLVAQQVVSQKDFAKTLAKVLNRPCWLKIPAMVIKLMLGQMGDELTLRGKSIQANRIKASGFKFAYPTLEEALTNLLIPNT